MVNLTLRLTEEEKNIQDNVVAILWENECNDKKHSIYLYRKRI